MARPKNSKNKKSKQVDLNKAYRDITDRLSIELHKLTTKFEKKMESEIFKLAKKLNKQK